LFVFVSSIRLRICAAPEQVACGTVFVGRTTLDWLSGEIITLF